MKTHAKTLLRSSLVLLLLLMVGLTAGYSQIAVNIPVTVAAAGSSVKIPINVGSLTGQSVTAYEFEVLCDSTILRFTGVDASGTLSDGLGPVANYFVAPRGPGRMKVTCASATDISGAGVLVYLTATAQNVSGSTSLTLQGFLFNAGTPTASITNGTFRTNSAPHMVSISSKTVAEKDTLRFNASATDVDLPSDTLRYNLVSAPTGATISATGAFLWVPNFGQAGSYTTWVKVADLAGATDSTSFSITVTHTNRAPSFVSKMRDTTINQGTTLTFAFSATDPDAGTTLTYSLVGAPSGASISSSGALTFTPPANPAASYLITAVASDGTLADTAKATVTVNRKPVFGSRTPASPSVISRNVSTTFTVTATDPDGNTLTFTWLVNGAAEKTGDNTFTRTFTDAQGTPKTVTAIFADPRGLKDSTVWNFTITAIEGGGVLPTEYSLSQNYPNPFNPSTSIQFDLPKQSPVVLEIHNVLGVSIRTLMRGELKSAGQYQIVWDGRDERGSIVPSGVYFYRISAGDFSAVRRMTLVK
jgi:hypothetical protein